MYAITYKNAYLHTDGKFYYAFLSMRGCKPVLYKTENGAKKRAMKYGPDASVTRLDND